MRGCENRQKRFVTARKVKGNLKYQSGSLLKIKIKPSPFKRKTK